MNSQVSDLFKHRKGAYHLLARVFLEPMSWEFFQTCSSWAVAFRNLPQANRRSLGARGLALLGRFCQGSGQDAQGRFQDLGWDYTRLFLGVPKKLAPPYESVYRGKEPLVMQKATIEVRRAYLEEELAIAEPRAQPDDHVGAELEFMYYLCARCLEAYQKKDWEEASRLLASQGRFLTEHMALWVPQFCEDVMKHALTDFYRAMALLLKSLVEEDESWVAGLTMEVADTLPKTYHLSKGRGLNPLG